MVCALQGEKNQIFLGRENAHNIWSRVVYRIDDIRIETHFRLKAICKLRIYQLVFQILLSLEQHQIV